MDLRQAIESAWADCVQLYSVGRINSERTLQAAMHGSLSEKLSSEYYVLCEPTFVLPDFGTVKPDILIVRGGYVLSAIELKFVPEYWPRYEDDLEKLKVYGRSTGSFPLLLEPTTGKYADRDFSFPPHCLLVFGVFGQPDAAAVDSASLVENMGELRDRFVPLVHAVC
jgi:hypothetical protein